MEIGKSKADCRSITISIIAARDRNIYNRERIMFTHGPEKKQ